MMDYDDLCRVAWLFENGTSIPPKLSQPLAVAIRDHLEDPCGRSLDYWLGLPPRVPQRSGYAIALRALLCRQVAETIAGTVNRKAQVITESVEIWESGEVAASSFDPPFRDFLRATRELQLPHLKDRTLRKILP